MSRDSLTILSLGAGVQSSCLYLMAAAGEFETTPFTAIFADTQSEPDSVYRQLDYLREKAGHIIPIHMVSQGNLADHILGSLGKTHGSVQQAPFHVRNTEGDGTDRGGMLWRKCTQEYKLAPIHREVRRLLKEQSLKRAEMWIGISTDEWARQKPSRQKYMINRYPLIQRGMTRKDCLRWMKERGHPEPPKSACRWCPYTSNTRWKEMRREAPDEFAKAVEFDNQLRTGKLPGVTGDCFVHRSMIPLAEVDLRTDEELGQPSLFGEFTEECEGMCGV